MGCLPPLLSIFFFEMGSLTQSGGYRFCKPRWSASLRDPSSVSPTLGLQMSLPYLAFLKGSGNLVPEPSAYMANTLLTAPSP